MSDKQITATVSILDKEYRIACLPEEEETLLNTARYLDQQMRDIRQAGRVIGTERIAVMAALNIAHELLEMKQNRSSEAQIVSQRIHNLQEKIEQALAASNPLEL